MKKAIEVFNKLALEYDRWFDENQTAYQSEVLAIRRFLPLEGNGLEIGVGTGRFAVACGIKTGVEPAGAMAELARQRGVTVYETQAESLPFSDQTFDFVLMVTVLCFLNEPIAALQEATRVLKRDGKLIIGIIDRDSPNGRIYESNKDSHEIYREATFYSTDQVQGWMESLNYSGIRICQTIFGDPCAMKTVEQFRDGHGDGVFVVLSGIKA